MRLMRAHLADVSMMHAPPHAPPTRAHLAGQVGRQAHRRQAHQAAARGISIIHERFGKLGNMRMRQTAEAAVGLAGLACKV